MSYFVFLVQAATKHANPKKYHKNSIRQSGNELCKPWSLSVSEIYMCIEINFSIYQYLSVLQMATVQDALATLCPKGPIKSQYPLTMEAIGQVWLEWDTILYFPIYSKSHYLKNIVLWFQCACTSNLDSKLSFLLCPLSFSDLSELWFLLMLILKTKINLWTLNGEVNSTLYNILNFLTLIYNL